MVTDNVNVLCKQVVTKTTTTDGKPTECATHAPYRGAVCGYQPERTTTDVGGRPHTG
jgi:hypothetical protein